MDKILYYSRVEEKGKSHLLLEIADAEKRNDEIVQIGEDLIFLDKILLDNEISITELEEIDFLFATRAVDIIEAINLEEGESIYILKKEEQGNE